MIRFALKSALALGLLAMVVPVGRDSAPQASGLDMLGVLGGAQEAASDIGGFCGRAPQACEAGRELALFMGDRIEAGARIGYAYLAEALSSVRADETPAAEGDARTDPVTTGTVGDMPPPRPYLPPRSLAASASREPAIRTVAIPTPAPRT